MDWSKYPLEKLVYFVAGVIPGFVALLVYNAACPGVFTWFLSLGFLGYRTKIITILVTSFLVGNSLTSFLGAILGGIGGAIGGTPYKAPHTHNIAPWRDPRWRAVLSKVLGADAPNNTSLMQPWLYEHQKAAINQQPDVAQRNMALFQLEGDKFSLERDDSEWSRWYDYYHSTVLRPSDLDVFFHVRRGLAFNLETTAVYLLISACFVHAVRQWWCILPSCLWTLILGASEWSEAKTMMDRWSTLAKQITYLSELSRR